MIILRTITIFFTPPKNFFPKNSKLVPRSTKLLYFPREFSITASTSNRLAASASTRATSRSLCPPPVPSERPPPPVPDPGGPAPGPLNIRSLIPRPAAWGAFRPSNLPKSPKAEPPQFAKRRRRMVVPPRRLLRPRSPWEHRPRRWGHPRPRSPWEQ